MAEAMFCGSVPVTFSIEGSGVNWVSINGQTGIEVPLGDVKAYAAAIDRLISQPELYYQYASAGKDRIQRYFTSQQSVAVINEIFHQLVDEPTSI
jgi:rhamnosyl/mannosyltransferase